MTLMVIEYDRQLSGERITEENGYTSASFAGTGVLSTVLSAFTSVLLLTF